jgi:uncharacterized membrane protein
VTSRRPALLPSLTLLAALLGGVGLRYDMAHARNQFFYDEGVSYLAATGHMGAIQRALNGGLTGRWVPARDWQVFMHPGPFWTFRTIASGLAHYDTHPPLYFWVLHVWVAIFGVRLSGGVALNTGIAILTGAALFFLARRILRNTLEASLVVAVWAVSPQVVQISQFARQYDQFGLFSVLFALAVLRAVDRDHPFRPRDGAFVALSAAGGVLTHYQFAIVAVVGGAYAVVRLWRVDRGRLARVAAACAAGALVFVALAPQFYLSVSHEHRLQAHGFQASQFPGRLHNVWTAVYSFLGLKVEDLRAAPSGLSIVTRPFWTVLSDGLVAAVVGALLVAVIVLLPVALRSDRLRPRLSAYRRRIDTTGLFVTAFFAVGIGAGIFGMYLSFQDPSYASRPRYLAPLDPFLALAVVLVARLLIGRARYVAVAALCLLVLLPASIGRLATFSSGPTHAKAIARAHHILDDGALRGTVVRMLYWVPPRTQVYVALDGELLANPSPWLDALQPNDLYIGVRAYTNTSGSIGEVERLLRTRFIVSRRHLGVRGTGELNVLLPLPGSSTTATK